MTTPYRDAQGLTTVSAPPCASILQSMWFFTSREHARTCHRPRCFLCRFLEDFLSRHRLFMDDGGTLTVMDDPDAEEIANIKADNDYAEWKDAGKPGRIGSWRIGSWRIGYIDDF